MNKLGNEKHFTQLENIAASTVRDTDRIQMPGGVLEKYHNSLLQVMQGKGMNCFGISQIPAISISQSCCSQSTMTGKVE